MLSVHMCEEHLWYVIKFKDYFSDTVWIIRHLFINKSVTKSQLSALFWKLLIRTNCCSLLWILGQLIILQWFLVDNFQAIGKGIWRWYAHRQFRFIGTIWQVIFIVLHPISSACLFLRTKRACRFSLTGNADQVWNFCD